MSLAADADTDEGRRQSQSLRSDDAGHRIGSDCDQLPRHRAHASRFARAHQRATASSTTATRRTRTPWSRSGHAKNSIHNVKNGIFTRGILIDIPRLKGVPYLEPGTPIYVEDLEAWEKQAGVKVSAGDALFVRTGVWARRERRRAHGCADERRAGGRPGFDPSVIPWLKRATSRCSGATTRSTSRREHRARREAPCTISRWSIWASTCSTTAISRRWLGEAASRKRWEFLLTAAPLPIRGGTGSPLNPIATF